MPEPKAFADNPILVRVCRGARVESVHRGSWVWVDTEGRTRGGQGQIEQPIFARSAVKCLQALPLVESGAADRFGFSEADLALALASHSGEPQHADRVRATLARLERTPDHLLCGSGAPMDGEARRALIRAEQEPETVHHNCSGKHAGFLALAEHFGVPAQSYLDPASASQQAVRAAVLEMTGLTPDELYVAIDGCSAPTFRMPLKALALAFARFGTPTGLSAEREAACQRLQAAAQAHPELIAGRKNRLCTELIKVGAGALFPKIGAEAVYAVAHVGRAEAFAVKMDDGVWRGVHAVVVALLQHLGWLTTAQTEELKAFRGDVLHNAAGLEVGSLDVAIEIETPRTPTL